MLTFIALMLSAILVAFVLLVGGVIVALTLAGARRRSGGSGAQPAVHPLAPLDPYAVGGPFAVRPDGLYDPNIQYGQPPTHHHQPIHHAGHMGGMGGMHGGGHMGGGMHSGGMGGGSVHGGH